MAMMIAIQGTPDFKDYNIFLRAMGVALSAIKEEDPYFYLYTAGPANINNFVLEFVNLSERGMKSRGKKIKFYKVAPKWIEENLNQFNYFTFLCAPNQQASPLAKKAESLGVDLGIFKY
jgi:hypothetical protein